MARLTARVTDAHGASTEQAVDVSISEPDPVHGDEPAPDPEPTPEPDPGPAPEPVPLDPSEVSDLDAFEDFTGYGSLGSLLADPKELYGAVGGASRMEFMPSGGLNDGPLLRYHFLDQHGWENPCVEQTTRMMMDFRKAGALGTNPREVWLEWWFRFSEDFDTVWPNKGRARVEPVGTFQEGERIVLPNGREQVLKAIQPAREGGVWLLWNDTLVADQGGEIRGKTSGATGVVLSEDLGCSQNADYKFILPAVFPDPTGRFGIQVGNSWNRHWLCYGPASPTPDVPATDSVGLMEQVTGRANYFRVTSAAWGPLKVWDGEAHRLRAHLGGASGDGARDGILRVWLDGRPLVDARDLAMDSRTVWGSKLGANHGRPGLDMTLDWLRWSVGATDPGW